jgi:autotransporter-associated beta strand protein
LVTLANQSTIQNFAQINIGTGGLGGTLNAATIQNNGTITFNLTDTTTLNAAISGSGSITKLGSGTAILTGNNTYSGITTINAGVLSISQDANLGTPPGAPVANQLTFDGGTLQATASFALNANRGIALLFGGGAIPQSESRRNSQRGRDIRCHRSKCADI